MDQPIRSDISDAELLEHARSEVDSRCINIADDAKIIRTEGAAYVEALVYIEWDELDAFSEEQNNGYERHSGLCNEPI